MERSIKPRGGRVIVEVLPREEVSPGGIILPDARAGRENRGRVLAVGDGRLTSKGARVPVGVEIGDVVVFDPYRVEVVVNDTGMRAAATEYARAGDRAVLREDAIHGVE